MTDHPTGTTPPESDTSADDDLFGSDTPRDPDTTAAGPAAGSGSSRPWDRTALISGLLFIILGIGVLADDAGWGGFDLELRWVWPILLIGLGLAGLLSSTRKR